MVRAGICRPLACLPWGGFDWTGLFPTTDSKAGPFQRGTIEGGDYRSLWLNGECCLNRPDTELPPQNEPTQRGAAKRDDYDLFGIIWWGCARPCVTVLTVSVVRVAKARTTCDFLSWRAANLSISATPGRPSKCIMCLPINNETRYLCIAGPRFFGHIF